MNFGFIDSWNILAIALSDGCLEEWGGLPAVLQVHELEGTPKARNLNL